MREIVPMAERFALARKVMAADADPAVVLYALDLVLFKGETLGFRATVDRQAKDLLVEIIAGVER